MEEARGTLRSYTTPRLPQLVRLDSPRGWRSPHFPRTSGESLLAPREQALNKHPLIADMETDGLNLDIPFGQAEELNSELRIIKEDKTTARLSRADGSSANALLGNPFVELEIDAIRGHLQSTISTTKLDKFAPHLWLVATPSSSSISPLHKQKILGRDIVITDTADLHLVWYHSKIFLKPLPKYLLSHAFWKFVFDKSISPDTLDQTDSLYRATLGFVRTYTHLIQSDSDFRIALSHGLLPETTTLGRFAAFINCFKDLPDSLASPRFHFGELRLTRLDLWSPFFLGQMHYFNMSRQYDQYFSRYFQPVLFTFGTFSVLLSAMQVALASEPEPLTPGDGWRIFISVSKWTAISTILIVVLIVLWLLATLLFKLLRELFYALDTIFVKRLSQSKGSA